MREDRELSSTTVTAPLASLRETVLRVISSGRPLPPRVTPKAGHATEPVEPSAPSESEGGFDPTPYQLDVRLADESGDGGLFGFAFR